MKDKHIIRYSREELPEDTKTDVERLKNMTEEEIHAAALADPDAQPTTEDFWKDAEIRMPTPKQSVTLRLDRDLVAWFKEQGRGYQTRMNAVLRSYMKTRQRDRD